MSECHVIECCNVEVSFSCAVGCVCNRCPKRGKGLWRLVLNIAAIIPPTPQSLIYLTSSTTSVTRLARPPPHFKEEAHNQRMPPPWCLHITHIKSIIHTLDKVNDDIFHILYHICPPPTLNMEGERPTWNSPLGPVHKGRYSKAPIYASSRSCPFSSSLGVVFFSFLGLLLLLIYSSSPTYSCQPVRLSTMDTVINGVRSYTIDKIDPRKQLVILRRHMEFLANLHEKCCLKLIIFHDDLYC